MRIRITYVCFIALLFDGSCRRCLKTWPSGLMFKELPRNSANVNA